MPDADKDILYRVAYEEAVRALAEQQAEIDSFRSRAGLLLSSTAITTSFLGAQSFDGGSFTATSWLALAAFAGVAAISLAILLPRPWEVTTNPREVIEPYIRREDPTPIDELHRELSFHMHNSYAENRLGLQRFTLFLQIASALSALEIVFWIITLATGT
ncbi:MAG TPA: hypothetical protein VF504_04390 [Solirubrobacterales bacterium]|jgi:hypothetical protein